MITRRINGGLNGYADRLDYYTRLGLVVLGFGPTEVLAFQKVAKGIGRYDGELDGEDGPKTRAAIHLMLADLAPKAINPVTVTPAPVVEEKPVPVPVTPPSLEKPWWQSKEVVGPVLTGGIFGGIGTFFEKFGGIPFENLALLLAAGVIALVAVLLFLRRRDQKAVARMAQQVEA